MSGYPGAPYPGAPGANPGASQQGGGYPGTGAPQVGGYPGQGAPQGGGYPVAGAPPGGGYPGAGASPGGGYPGAGTPQEGGYPGVAAPQGGRYPGPGAPQGGGYPVAGAPQGGGYPGAGVPQGGGYPGAGAPKGGEYPGSSAPTDIPERSSHQDTSFSPISQYPSNSANTAPVPGVGGAPVTQVDPAVAQWFQAVDQDNNGHIDSKELSQALVNGDMSHFSQEACQTMIKMFDVNLTGTIEIDEFGKLFEYIQQWKGMFEGFDRDRRGVLDEREFSQALQQMGYRFSPTFVQNLLSKLSPRERKLTLDNFIVVCVQIRRLTDSFRSRDLQMAGTASFMYEDFVGLAMGAHK